MELKTFYKNGKEYAADQLKTKKAVSAADKTVTINGVVYKLKHAKEPKPEKAPRTYKRKK